MILPSQRCLWVSRTRFSMFPGNNHKNKIRIRYSWFYHIRSQVRKYESICYSCAWPWSSYTPHWHLNRCWVKMHYSRTQEKLIIQKFILHRYLLINHPQREDEQLGELRDVGQRTTAAFGLTQFTFAWFLQVSTRTFAKSSKKKENLN